MIQLDRDHVVLGMQLLTNGGIDIGMHMRNSKGLNLKTVGTLPYCNHCVILAPTVCHECCLAL
jgi:hypothetical protein